MMEQTCKIALELTFLRTAASTPVVQLSDGWTYELEELEPTLARLVKGWSGIRSWNGQ